MTLGSSDKLPDNTIPLDQGLVMNDPVVIEFWNRLEVNVAALRDDMAKTVQDLMVNMDTSKQYLQQFVDGNNVDESFYKLVA